MKKMKLAAIVTALFISPFSLMASPTLIDFDGLSAGTVVTDQYSGVDFSLLGAPPIDGPIAYILDDEDGSSVDIFGATGNAIVPGNVTDGFWGNPLYDFEIAFDKPIDFFSIMALDAEETVSAHGYLGNTLVQ